MRRQLNWHRVSREMLAEHLQKVEVTRAEAVGDASLYRCQGPDGESVAIALPGDEGLIIYLSLAIPATLERRRQVGENTPLDE